MGKKHKFVWDGRGERGEDARFSIMAGRTATDLRLTLVHFRILSHLGRFNHKKGWCRLSQAGLAEMFGVGRQAVNAAVGELVDWKYIEKQSQAESGESFCLYRIVIDRDDEGGVSCTGDTPQDGEREGGVSPTADTPPGGECRVQATPVSAPDDTRVALEATPPKRTVNTTRAHIDHIDHVDSHPPTPQARRRARGARGRDNLNSGEEVAQLLAPLRGKPELAGVVSILIEPIARQRKVLSPDPAYTLAQVAAWCAGIPETVLKAAAHQVLELRHSAVTEEAIIAAVRGAQRSAGLPPKLDRPAAPRVAADGLMNLAEKENPEAFAAWLAEHKALAHAHRPNQFTMADVHRHIRVPTLFPPGYQPAEVRP